MSTEGARPRVLHVVEKYAVSGETYVYDQVRRSSTVDDVLVAERLLHGAKVDGLTAYGWRRSMPAQIERGIARAGRAWERPFLSGFGSFVQRRAARMRAQLLHAHFGMAGWKVLGARRRTGLPLIVTFYGVDVSHCLVDPYWRPRIEQVVATADRSVVLCEEAADRLIAIGAAPDRVRIWDIGIPLDEYPYRPPTRERASKLLNVARFVEKKGHRHLLDAFREVRDARPGTTLTLIGNGPMRGDVDRWIDELDLRDAVQLVDTTGLPDFFSLFKSALADHDLFVLPSVVASNGDDEGGPPVVITNAMAVGLPVVATPVGGIGRAITDGVSGVLTEPEDPRALAAAVIGLLDDPERRVQLSERARRRAEERFDRTKQLATLEELYREVVA